VLELDWLKQQQGASCVYVVYCAGVNGLATGCSLLSELGSSLAASYPWISPYHPYHNGAAAAAAAAAVAAAQLVRFPRRHFVCLSVRLSQHAVDDGCPLNVSSVCVGCEITAETLGRPVQLTYDLDSGEVGEGGVRTHTLQFTGQSFIYKIETNGRCVLFDVAGSGG